MKQLQAKLNLFMYSHIVVYILLGIYRITKFYKRISYKPNESEESILGNFLGFALVVVMCSMGYISLYIFQ